MDTQIFHLDQFTYLTYPAVLLLYTTASGNRMDLLMIAVQ